MPAINSSSIGSRAAKRPAPRKVIARPAPVSQPGPFRATERQAVARNRTTPAYHAAIRSAARMQSAPVQRAAREHIIATTRQTKPMYRAPGAHRGMLIPGNIDIAHRPVAHNPDGTISTVRSITVTVDGKHHLLLPTVVHGRVVSNDVAIRHWQETGQHLGLFTTERAADAYGVALHNQQAKMYSKPQPTLEQLAILLAGKK